MKNRWIDQEASEFIIDPLQLRAYTSRLLGADPNLVLHGGGNTSLKIREKNLFEEEEDILYVKGSGLDLSKIEVEGFTPLRLSTLRKLAVLENISDSEMVRQQQMLKTKPGAPSPSVEALLHAIIPFDWIDHTHADAVVTLTNTSQKEGLIQKVFGKRLLIVPYVMPGFKLAKKIFHMTQEVNWNNYEGILLCNHGIITYGNSARESYERMIELVSVAENYFDQYENAVYTEKSVQEDLQSIARIRKKVSQIYGGAMLMQMNNSPEACGFSNLPNIKEISSRGPITSDHLIRIKPFPVFLDLKNLDQCIKDYSAHYETYFNRHTNGHQILLDRAPRWALWPGHGTAAFGRSLNETRIVADITEHTVKAIQYGEALGGWEPVSEAHLFESEYWDLQQEKLKKNEEAKEFQGKIAIVSGAASGIGLACSHELHQQGAVVVGLDLNEEVSRILQHQGMLGILCDVSDQDSLSKAVVTTVRRFGGLDVLVLNAGTFPAGQTIENMEKQIWQKSLEINLTAPQQLLQECVPFLKEGIDPSVVFIASRNVQAPGPGASAYSVPKAGQTQLARIAALELGKFGVRVNILHPDCVYDTGLWTEEALQLSAKRYGLTVEEYKSRNILKIDVKTQEVAKMVCAMAGSIFVKTTGAQIPIDGGNERVI